MPGGRSSLDPIDGDGGNRHAEMWAELGFSSFHPAGCHFSLVDGSVRFFSEDIDSEVLRWLTTRAGNEVVDASSF